MRELKFRAWRDGELLEEVTPVANTDNNFFPYPAIVIFEANGEIGGTEEVSCIEQFTGLKDKNGKEIYENDIVEYTTCYYGNTKRQRKVVEWKEWDSDDFGEPHNIGYFDLSECMVVIGNVRENADLLGDK